MWQPSSVPIAAAVREPAPQIQQPRSSARSANPSFTPPLHAPLPSGQIVAYQQQEGAAVQAAPAVDAERKWKTEFYQLTLQTILTTANTGGLVRVDQQEA